MEGQKELTTKVKLHNVRLSFPNLFEPYGKGDAVKKYQATFLIDKKDKTGYKKIMDAIENAKIVDKAKFLGKTPKKMPLKDGDEDEDGREEYQGMWFICSRNSIKFKPKVFDTDGEPPLDNSDIYAGCYGTVILNFYGYNFEGTAGVSSSIVGFKKTKDGERLSGGGNVTSEDFEDDDV